MSNPRSTLTPAGVAHVGIRRLWLPLAIVVAALCGHAGAQPAARPAIVAEQGQRWNQLTEVQRLALKPLEGDWAGIGADHKQKWLEVAARFPAMSDSERERIQVRMSEWARLTPLERGRARLNYQQAKQVPAEDRQARWESYQSLTPEERRALAARAASANSQAVPARRAATVTARRPDLAAAEGPRPKSNIVPNTSFAAPPRPIAPSVVRAQPGATTTLISKPAAPPSHQQTGLPKIAATPQFVDRATLLPQRGPQAAGVQAAPAASAAQPRR